MNRVILVIFPLLLLISCTSKKIQQSKSPSTTYIPPTPPKRTATYRSPKPKIDTNNIAAFTTVQMPGWRIQLKPTDNRNKMLSTRTKLISFFSQHKIYTVYHSPFYKMRVGNFKLKADAARLKAKLQPKFPGEAIYVVQDTIEYRMPRAEMIALKMRQVQ